MRSNVAVGWIFPCKVTDNCKILTFSPRKIIDSTLTQAVSSWLNSDSNDDQSDSTLTRLISLIFTADSTLTRLIWVRVESNLTHDSWVEHNPGKNCFYPYRVKILIVFVSNPSTLSHICQSIKYNPVSVLLLSCFVKVRCRHMVLCVHSAPNPIQSIRFSQIVPHFHSISTSIWISTPLKGSSNQYQSCARLRFFGLTWPWVMCQSRWFNSRLNSTLLDWLSSHSTQIPIMLAWLISDSTQLSRSLVKSYSRLITFYLTWPKVIDRGGGDAVKCSCGFVISQ